METTILLQAITDALRYHSIDDIVIAILQIDKNATRIKDVADLSVNQYFDKIDKDDISASYLNKIRFICLLNIYKNMNINLKKFAIIYNKNYSTIKNYNNILKSNLKYPKIDKFLSDCLEKTYNNFKTNIYEQKY